MCFIHGLRTTELRSLRLQDVDFGWQSPECFTFKKRFFSTTSDSTS
ncbi:hypothetical protein [Yersinia enterocolitica]